MSKHATMLDSFGETERRKNEIQGDLVQIAYAMGSSRSKLENRGRWYEACRDPKSVDPLRPYSLEDEMIRDAVNTVANRGTVAERKAVRQAVEHYYATRCRLSLEMLGDDSEDVVALTLESNREICEASNALTTAINTKRPEDFERAAREQGDVLSITERLEDALNAARARFLTPRSVKLMGTGR